MSIPADICVGGNPMFDSTLDRYGSTLMVLDMAERGHARIVMSNGTVIRVIKAHCSTLDLLLPEYDVNSVIIYQVNGSMGNIICHALNMLNNCYLTSGCTLADVMCTMESESVECMYTMEEYVVSIRRPPTFLMTWGNKHSIPASDGIESYIVRDRLSPVVAAILLENGECWRWNIDGQLYLHTMYGDQPKNAAKRK